MGLSLQKLPPRVITGGAEDQSWQPEGSSHRIEFTGTILEQVRFEASRAMNGYACVGIGGVLLGRRDADGDIVESWRPIACDHSRGPAFILSARDESALSAFLEGVTVSEDEPVQILGWFVSHPKGELSATEAERLLHRRHLPNGSFLMIIRPDRLGDAEVQVHLPVRGPGGAIRPAEPLLLVEPLPIAKREPGQRRRKRRPPVAPASTGLTVVKRARAAAPPSAPAPVRQANPRASWRLLAVAAVLVALGAVGAAMAVNPRVPNATLVTLPADPPLEILSLHAVNHEGVTNMTWNGKSAAVLYATRGELEIHLGEKTVKVELTSRQVQAGEYSLKHPPGHPIEMVKLVLFGEGGGSFDEMTRIESARPEEPPTTPLPASMVPPLTAKR